MLDKSTREDFFVCSNVVFWGMAGTMTRMLCDNILVWTNTTLAFSAGPIGSDFLSNMLGCSIMGLLVHFSVIKGRSKTIYTALTSGFCGCLTTFSGWQGQSAISYFTGHIVDGLLSLIVGMCTFFCLLVLGIHIGELLEAIFGRKEKNSNQNNVSYNRNDSVSTNKHSTHDTIIEAFEWLFAILCVPLWIMFAMLFAFVSSSRTWSGAALFAPVGVIPRWYTSRWNENWPKFKLFTFLVNVIGTIVYCVMIIGERQFRTTTDIRYIILFSIQLGICGCLTTVSTFVSELNSIPGIHCRYIYGFTSVFVTQAFCLIILGIGFHFS